MHYHLQTTYSVDSPPSLRPIALVLVAGIGSLILFSAQVEAQDGLLQKIIGAGVLIICLVGAFWLANRQGTFRPLVVTPAPSVTQLTLSAAKLFPIALTVVTVVCAWLFNADNRFTGFGILCWLTSVLFGCWSLKGSHSTLKLPRVRTLHVVPWQLAALLIIVCVGMWFRFRDLSNYPPDMTSDQVEKLLDVNRVLHGQYLVFFPNNGGREGFQMYYLALLKQITGLPISYDLLKIGSGLEGLALVALAWWIGKTVFGEEDEQLGALTGLIMAAFIATSYWATGLSRLGLRIPTCPLVVGMVLIWLSKAMRHNRRRDWLLVGLALGFGMYCYQALRFLPIVVGVGYIFALAAIAKNRTVVLNYSVNMAACTIIALIVFVPLAHYMFQYPADFWQRTSSRVFGSDFVVDLKSGQVLETIGNRELSLQKDLPILLSNMGRAVLMFNWKGDSSPFNWTASGIPELDFFTGGLFTLGLGLLGARILRRRDPVDWLLPTSILILIMPSALALAYRVEVPSATRASGSLPIVYLTAAFALAWSIRSMDGRWKTRLGLALSALLIVLLSLGGLSDFNSYFVAAAHDNRMNIWPHHQAGQVLHEFIQTSQAPGNAFIISADHWWDHRAVAIEAGDPEWNNGLPAETRDRRQQILERMRTNVGTRYELHPDDDLIFFIFIGDAKARADLESLFPNGVWTGYDSYTPRAVILVYKVPAVGCAWIWHNVQNSRFCVSPTYFFKKAES